MISSRYAIATIVLVVAALVPTIIHSYAGVVDQDGLSTDRIPASLGEYDSSTPTRRSPDWGRRRFESFDWFEREYASSREKLVLTVVRSFDLKALYHHPELAVAYHFANFDDARVGTIDGHPEMPVHVLSNQGGGAAGLYVLHYGGRFIDEPIRFQIRTAGELFFTGRRPMTLLFVRDDSVAAGVDPLTIPAARLLLDAVRHFVEPEPPPR